MAQRRFGPTAAAGVAVIEQDADKILEPASLGVTAYLGVFARGDTGKLISTYSKRQALKKLGKRIAGSTAPDCVQDFYDHSGGAGELHAVRVTDGNERAATYTLYSRESAPSPVATISAKNGGRWAGQRRALIGAYANSAAISETALTTGVAMKVNELAGANLYLDAVAGKSYKVISNDVAGVLTVSSDSLMKTDTGVSVDLGYMVELPRDTADEVTFEVGDGEADPANLFSITVYVDGLFVKKYPNLSMDPASQYYFVSLINSDDGNDEITVADLNAPNSVTALKRPANESGTVATATATVLTITPFTYKITSPGGGNPTVVLGATSDIMKYRDRIELTMTSATAFTAKSLDLGAGAALGSGTAGTPFTPSTPYLPPFTLTAGGTALTTGDKIVIYWMPLDPSALIGGVVYPDKVNFPLTGFRISANDHKSITILSGDMTTVSTVGDSFTVVYPQGLRGGYDGGTPTDANFTACLDASTSKFNGLMGQNKGLVKLASPGKNTTAVQKAGLAFAEAKNWQWRVEIPDTVVTEATAVAHINSTIGRSDMGVVAFPSYAYCDDPDKPGLLKLIPLTGMIHGREAAVAKAWEGYHKAAAGTDVTLPRILQLPAGTEQLNEEALNPQGLNVIKKNKGNFIIWGDRSISIDPAWKFKHQREQMSHYENRLREGLDWIVFAINDPFTQADATTALYSMFKPEWTKRALRGNSLEEAISIKMGDDINTDATRAAGDLNCEIKLRLADTVERFVIRIGKAGIFESLSS